MICVESLLRAKPAKHVLSILNTNAFKALPNAGLFSFKSSGYLINKKIFIRGRLYG